jgi:hypothetical protein
MIAIGTPATSIRTPTRTTPQCTVWCEFAEIETIYRAYQVLLFKHDELRSRCPRDAIAGEVEKIRF